MERLEKSSASSHKKSKSRGQPQRPEQEELEEVGDERQDNESIPDSSRLKKDKGKGLLVKEMTLDQ